MKSSRVVTALDKAHGQALEALAAVGARVDGVEAQLATLKAQRKATLEKHSAKAADAIAAGGTAPAAPDLRKVDVEIEALEGVHRELAKRRRAQADVEIAARLRGLENGVTAEEKRYSALLKAVSDAEQSILGYRADAEGSRTRQAELREQLAEAKRLSGDGLVCCIFGELDAIEAGVEDPTNLIDRIEARKHLARWRAGDPQLHSQNIYGVDQFRERKRVISKAAIYYLRETGQVLSAVEVEWRDAESPVWNHDIQGPEGHLSNLERYVRLMEFEKEQSNA